MATTYVLIEQKNLERQKLKSKRFIKLLIRSQTWMKFSN